VHLARVIGSVVATRKEEELEGLKFLLLEHANPKGDGRESYVVAIDAVGAGAGDLVMYASGSSARQTAVTKDRPVDATVMAIVDQIEDQGALAYSKSDDS
jgi:microcompartment protein CcmK/EutM|tara:strand:- start:183 stop:482 length:300 start_codon:yes stop_codon:yes gene_type:complete